jgi:hypothetical protein
VLSCDVIIWDDNTPLFIFPENFTHSYIPLIDLLFCCWKICGPILGIDKSLTDTWMWKEIGTRAAQFTEKEYINGIFVAVYCVGRRDCVFCVNVCIYFCSSCTWIMFFYELYCTLLFSCCTSWYILCILFFYYMFPVFSNLFLILMYYVSPVLLFLVSCSSLTLILFFYFLYSVLLLSLSCLYITFILFLFYLHPVLLLSLSCLYPVLLLP